MCLPPGVAYVRYSSSKCAAYAKDKLNGFEYPTGYRLSVRYPGQSAAAGDGYARHGCVFFVDMLRKKERKFQKSEFTMEVGGWVGPGLTRNFCLENLPKIALYQY